MRRGFRVLAAYFSPVHDDYAKPDLAPSSARIRMLELASADRPWLSVDVREASQSTVSPSFVVAEHLAARTPNATVFFVCGADLVHSMRDPAKWPPRNVHRLLDAAHICVLRREGSEEPPQALHDKDGCLRRLLLVDMPAIPGSSTEVRYVSFRGRPEYP